MSIDSDSSAEPRVARSAAAGGSPRAVVYMCGVRDERPFVMEALEERTLKWGADQGYEIVETCEDDLVDWSAKHREELGNALGLLAKGQADVLVIPLEAYSQLRHSDQEWLKTACAEFGGRVETVPPSPSRGLTSAPAQ